MKVLSLSLLALACLASTAQAGKPHLLHGLFCNTQAQAREALDLVASNMELSTAVRLVNRGAVVCTIVDRIHYLVDGVIRLDTVEIRNQPLTLYEGQLVGVLVGNNMRPVTPAAPIFFVLNTVLPGVASQGGT